MSKILVIKLTILFIKTCIIHTKCLALNTELIFNQQNIYYKKSIRLNNL
jgi:hypothetical protein